MPPRLTIAPPRVRLRCGRQDWVHRNAPSSTIAITRRHSSSLMSSKGVSLRTAALLTRMSRRPNCLTVASTMAATAAGSVTSAMWSAALPPPDLIMATVCFASFCEVFAFTMTEAPPAASERQMARPMFRAPPVTSATFPASSVPGVIPASPLTNTLRSLQISQDQQEPPEDGGVPQQDDAAGIALRRVRVAPETVEDRGRNHGEEDEAVDADLGIPVENQQRTAGELQRDADPERGGGRRRAERGHALDVILDSRAREVAQTCHEEADHDQEPSCRVQPRSISVHRRFSLIIFAAFRRRSRDSGQDTPCPSQRSTASGSTPSSRARDRIC